MKVHWIRLETAVALMGAMSMAAADPAGTNSPQTTTVAGEPGKALSAPSPQQSSADAQKNAKSDTTTNNKSQDAKPGPVAREVQRAIEYMANHPEHGGNPKQNGEAAFKSGQRMAEKLGVFDPNGKPSTPPDAPKTPADSQPQDPQPQDAPTAPSNPAPQSQSSGDHGGHDDSDGPVHDHDTSPGKHPTGPANTRAAISTQSNALGIRHSAITARRIAEAPGARKCTGGIGR